MNCQEICKISPKRLNRSANIPKVLGATIFETHCIAPCIVHSDKIAHTEVVGFTGVSRIFQWVDNTGDKVRP